MKLPHPLANSSSDQAPRATGSVAPTPTRNISPQIIGERLRTARYAANQTQQQLARDTYTKSFISAVEHGKMTPSFQALGILAERLGVPISYLLGEQAKDSSALTEASDGAHSPQERAAQKGEERLALLRREAEELIQRGQDEEAATYLRQHLEAAQQSGDALSRGVVLGALVALHLARGEYEQSIAVAQETLVVAQAHQDYDTAGQVYLSLVTANAALQDQAVAEQAFQEAITAFEQAGRSDWLSHAHEQYGHFLAARKRYQDAYEQLRLAQATTNG
jgi:transcriptional regulator with XRE-family HTH domain